MRSPWKGTVTYAAGVPFNYSPYFPRHGSGDRHGFIQFAQRRDLSEEQRQFLETTEGGLEASHSGGRDPYTLPDFYTPSEDPNSPQFLLYAVSLDDAKKMAEAYLRYASDSFRDRIAPRQDEVRKLSEKLAAEQQKLPEAIQSAEAAERAFREMAKQVPYREDKQALDAAAELDRMLNTAQVDIAGIQAALKAIQDQMKALSSNVHPLKSKLEAMFVEESIALQAAEARKHMATTLRKQADNYIDLKQAMQTANTEKDRLAHDLSVVPDMIRRAREILAAEMQKEPKIINNKVFIYPVKQAEEPAGN